MLQFLLHLYLNLRTLLLLLSYFPQTTATQNTQKTFKQSLQGCTNSCDIRLDREDELAKKSLTVCQ